MTDRPTSASDKTAVSTPDAPAALAGAYSQGVRKGGLLAVSGQGAGDPKTNALVGEGDVRAQARQTLRNLKTILEAGGASLADVIMMRVYLTTRDNFAALNEVYNEFFDEHAPGVVRPSRTTVFVQLPLPEMLVEIDALAVVG